MRLEIPLSNVSRPERAPAPCMCAIAIGGMGDAVAAASLFVLCQALAAMRANGALGRTPSPLPPRGVSSVFALLDADDSLPSGAGHAPMPPTVDIGDGIGPCRRAASSSPPHATRHAPSRSRGCGGVSVVGHWRRSLQFAITRDCGWSLSGLSAALCQRRVVGWLIMGRRVVGARWRAPRALSRRQLLLGFVLASVRLAGCARAVGAGRVGWARVGLGRRQARRGRGGLRRDTAFPKVHRCTRALGLINDTGPRQTGGAGIHSCLLKCLCVCVPPSEPLSNGGRGRRFGPCTH